jgi:hypothetical protein
MRPPPPPPVSCFVKRSPPSAEIVPLLPLKDDVKMYTLPPEPAPTDTAAQQLHTPVVVVSTIESPLELIMQSTHVTLGAPTNTLPPPLSVPCAQP